MKIKNIQHQQSHSVYYYILIEIATVNIIKLISSDYEVYFIVVVNGIICAFYICYEGVLKFIAVKNFVRRKEL